MPLSAQLAQVVLRGLNTHADSRLAVPGELELCENLFFKRSLPGGAELRKRFGVTALPGGGTLGTGKRLATFGDQRLVSTDTTLYSYSPQTGLWHTRGQSSFIGVSSTPVHAGSPYSHGMMDTAVSGNLMCVAAVLTAGGDVSVTVIDLVTGLPLLSEESLVGFIESVHVVALADGFVVFNQSASSATLTARKIAYATPTTIGAAVTVVTDLHLTPRLDVIRNGTADSVLVAYRSNATTLKLAIWNGAMTLGATTAVAEDPGQCMGWLHWDQSDGKAYLGYVGAAVGIKVANLTIAGFTATTSVCDAAVTAARNITGFYNGFGTPHVFYEVTASPAYNSALGRADVGGGSVIFQRGLALWSRVFKIGLDRYYVLATHDSPLQAGYYLLDVGLTRKVVGRAFYGEGAGASRKISCLANAAAIDANRVAVPVLRIAGGSTWVPGGSTVLLYAGWNLTFDFSGNGLSSYARVGESLYMTGSIVRSFDGAATTEAGPLVFPEKLTLTPAALGGSLTPLGSYQYVCIYAWDDARGQRFESAPSEPVTVTLTGADNRVTMVIPTNRFSDRPVLFGSYTMTIEVYRTTAGGSTFYKWDNGVGASIPNSPGVDTLTYIDVQSDASIEANAVLYTTGGVLPHISPPPARLMAAWRGRIFLAGTEQPTDLWPSNEVVEGEGISFSSALKITMESEGGPITALCELDDRLVIFKRGSIYQLAGAGPTLAGAGNFEQPSRVTTVAGAVSQSGVVKTRDGIVFKSTRGFYLLPLGGGSPVRLDGVEAYDGLTVTGATAVEDLEQVRFTTAEGRTLVYHYGLRDERGVGVWTTFTGQAAVDCIVWNGRFVYLASDATVQEEVAEQYNDNGAAIVSKLRTGWLALGGLAGFERLWAVRIVGEFMGAHTLRLTPGYDYEATPGAALTVAPAANPYHFEARPARQQATALQLTLEDVLTGAGSAGFRLTGLGLLVGLQPGLPLPLATTRRMT